MKYKDFWPKRHRRAIGRMIRRGLTEDEANFVMRSRFSLRYFPKWESLRRFWARRNR